MIHCPNCDIDYSPQGVKCPRCKRFETPREPRFEFLRNQAFQRIADGLDAELVRADLIEQGFSELEADRTLEAAQKAHSRENRHYGLKRLLMGLAMIFAGLILLGYGFLGFHPEALLDAPV